MKKIFLFSALIFSFSANSQLLGVYEFAGLGACPNQSPNVTVPLVNSEFDDFSMQNVFCVSTQNVFNSKSWNTTSIVNESEFIQFGIHTISCFRINLDSIIFDFRNTPAGLTPTWHLRSSIDNYTTDIASGASATSSSMLTDTIVFNPANFSLLADVKFRIYLTEMGSAGAAFRIDNVQFYGNEQFVGTVDYYVDADGDGFGTGVSTQACTNPGGYSLNNTDCDDNNAAINPNTFWYSDNDGDGFGNDVNFEIGCSSTLPNPVTNSDDCNDGNLAINPNTLWYQDNDNDGFGDDATTEIGCSSTLTNPVLVGGDCNELNADVNPNTIWYEDVDGDFYGNSANFQIGCTHTFTLASNVGGDCMDDESSVYPNAPELCDGFDNDCNNLVDDGLTTTVYYIDNDGDGFGAGSAGDFCSDPGIGYTLNNSDCNDDDASINSNATDIPNNGIDENCDGQDLIIDNDFDGFNSDLDCDDNNSNVFPGNSYDDTDVCGDGIDNDCDGSIDEGYDDFACNGGGGGATDNDFDGYDEFSDCNDGDASINPGASDIPNNGIDENCDGVDLVIDMDGDGVNSSIDCDDNNSNVFPGNSYDDIDVCGDGIDNDCDGFTDEGYDDFACNGGGGGATDNDFDGYDEFSDCNDSDFTINPGATDIPNNGIDEDCDGQDLINGINEILNARISIFPNPGTDKFFISSDNLEKGENEIKITDINGKIIFESKFEVVGNFATEIHTTNFNKGVYQIILISGNQISRANWIKL